VVLCTGVGTGALCRELGLDFPMQARRVQIAVLRTDQPQLTTAFGMADAGMSGCPDALDGHFRFASSAHGEVVDPRSVNDVPTLPEVEAQMLDRVGKIFTNLGERTVVRRWSGLIDTVPDPKPVLDALSSPQGLVLAAGFSGHGFCLGPISGRLIADMILRGQTAFSLHAFRWARFALG
jgi:sarcosine oxidase subunit beta